MLCDFEELICGGNMEAKEESKQVKVVIDS